MQVGKKYNWINQPERLVYLGLEGVWHQFAKIESPDVVWCEVLESDLDRLEETKQAKKEPTKKIFLTSWPSGQLVLVDVLGKNERIKNGIYIRYPKSFYGGGTDTTSDKFLFDLPVTDEPEKTKGQATATNTAAGFTSDCKECNK